MSRVNTKSIKNAGRLQCSCNPTWCWKWGWEHKRLSIFPGRTTALRPWLWSLQGCCLLLDGETWLPLACIEKRQRSLFRQKSITVQKQLCVIQPSWKQGRITGLLPEWLCGDREQKAGVLLTCHISVTILDMWMVWQAGRHGEQMLVTLSSRAENEGYNWEIMFAYVYFSKRTTSGNSPSKLLWVFICTYTGMWMWY